MDRSIPCAWHIQRLYDGALKSMDDIATKASAAGFHPEHQHPEYAKNMEAWETTRDVYLGAEGVGRNVTQYIPQRSIGEARENYDERLRLAHYSGLLGAIVDALIGLWSRKPPEEDTWGELGEKGEDGKVPFDSVAKRILDDADRKGMTWGNHRRARACWSLVYKEVYTLIDTNREPTSGNVSRAEARSLDIRPYVKLISPLNVLDWVEVDGRKIDVVIREAVDSRPSLDAGAGELSATFLRLSLDGWKRYRLNSSGVPEIVAGGSGSYRYYSQDGRRCLPLVCSRLPTPRYAAFNLARIVLAIVNHDSHLDSLMRAGALAQFLAVQGDDEEIRNNIRGGEKILPYPPNMNTPEFVGHLMTSAEHLEKRLASLGDQFWRAAMYEFSDSPVEKTATQIEQQWASGVGAFLALLSGAMQESENAEKWLLYQAVNPQQSGRIDPDSVGITTFSENFRVEDVISEMTRLRDLLFGIGERIPVGDTLGARISEHVVRQLDTHAAILSQAGDVNVRQEIEEAWNEEAQAAERMAAAQILEEPPEEEEEEEAED